MNPWRGFSFCITRLILSKEEILVLFRPRGTSGVTKASLSTPPSSPRKTLASRSFYYKLLCFGRRLCWTLSQKGVIDIIVSAAEESGRSLSIIVFLGTKPRPTNSTVCFLVIARRPRRILVWRATVDKHNVHKTIHSCMR